MKHKALLITAAAACHCILCIGATLATQPAAPAAQPTQQGKEQAPLSPRTLKEWLVGKEVVELTFAGPHMEPLKLRESLKTKVAPTDWDFRMSAGEGGGLGAFVRVCMKVTPDNVQRLLALQAELEPRGYPLQPQTAHIWSYAGNEPAREKARRLVPDALTAAERGIRQILPDAQFAPQRRGKVVLGEIRYEVPGTNVRGMLCVEEIRAQMVLRAVPPDDVVHLPRLGLMITSYYQPIPDGGAKDVSPKHASIRKSIREAVGPLMELETTPSAPRPAPAAPRTNASRTGTPSATYEKEITGIR